MIKRYEHRQVGYLIIIALTVGLLLIAALMAMQGFGWIAFTALIILGASLVLFASLTVVLWEDLLEIRFGPGIIRKKFHLKDIESCHIVPGSVSLKKEVGLSDFLYSPLLE